MKIKVFRLPVVNSQLIYYFTIPDTGIVISQLIYYFIIPDELSYSVRNVSILKEFELY